VVLPPLDKSQPSVQSAIDVALRRTGCVPAYLLTDNEKIVTVEHVAGISVRNAAAVEFGRHYPLTELASVIGVPGCAVLLDLSAWRMRSRTSSMTWR
jgi:hypothetical protein